MKCGKNWIFIPIKNEGGRAVTSVNRLYSDLISMEKTNFFVLQLLFISSSLLLLDLEFILFAQELISFADSCLHDLLH
jgi:hypothetical protein